MTKTFSWLSTFCGALALVSLVQGVIDLELNTIFKTTIEYYRWLTEKITILLKPIITSITALLGFTINLYSHWVDIVTLFMLYLGRDYTTSKNYNVQSNPIASKIVWIIGIISGLIASIIVGSTPLDTTNKFNLIIITCTPALGIFVYEFFDSLQHSFTPALRRQWAVYGKKEDIHPLRYFGSSVLANCFFVIVPILCILLGVYFIDYSETRNIFIYSIFGQLIWISIYWIVFDIKSVVKTEGIWNWKSITNGYHWKLGTGVFNIVIGAIIFFAANGLFNYWN